MSWNYSQVVAKLKPLRTDLVSAYSSIKLESLPATRVYMKNFIYQAWAVISTLKALRSKLSPSTVPWYPPEDENSVRYINEILLDEETDVAGQPQQYSSHYNLFIKAMREANGFSEPMETLVTDLRQGMAWDKAFIKNKDQYKHIISPSTFKYVENEIGIAMNGDLHQIAGFFFLGREETVPDLFSGFVKSLNEKEVNAPLFKSYIQRHIDLDGDLHAPLGEKITQRVCKEDPKMWKEVYEAGKLGITDDLNFAKGVTKMIGKPLTLYEAVGGRSNLEKVIEAAKSRINADAAEKGLGDEDGRMIVNSLSEDFEGPSYPADQKFGIPKNSQTNLKVALLDEFSGLLANQEDAATHLKKIKTKLSKSFES
ncbi:unnamed protein product [Blepharisma stoltei]|uniref:Uncharacterized protein n=1 Tax=Blepharisma stoltei TaxID=1481888 RepID=A0AAU9J264_9CILI|nr:unnamed protein product [Blepharisma stoltei]